MFSCVATKPKRNCGMITNQGVDIIYEIYWIEIQNDSTKNKRIFNIPRENWFSMNMDKKICVDSLDVW